MDIYTLCNSNMLHTQVNTFGDQQSLFFSFNFKKDYLYSVCIGIFLNVCVCVKVPDPLGQELWTVESCHWGLGVETGSSGRAAKYS